MWVDIATLIVTAIVATVIASKTIDFTVWLSRRLGLRRPA